MLEKLFERAYGYTSYTCHQRCHLRGLGSLSRTEQKPPGLLMVVCDGKEMEQMYHHYTGSVKTIQLVE